MWTWADELRSRSGLDEVVKRTRNSLHLRVDRRYTLALCVSPGGPPLHLRHPKTGLWVPAEFAQPGLVERVLEWVNRPLVDLALGPLAAMADYTAAESDGHIEGAAAVYATARDTSTAYVMSQTANFQVGQRYRGSPYFTYYIWRVFLAFDTSSIGAGSTVTDSSLTLTAASWSTIGSTFNLDLCEQDWSQDWSSSANREADYDGCLAAGVYTDLGNVSTFTVNTPKTTTGLSVDRVSLTGYTMYSLRSSRDRTGTAPTSNEYGALYSSGNSTAAYRPILTVLYEAAPTSFVANVMRHHFIPPLGPEPGGRFRG